MEPFFFSGFGFLFWEEKMQSNITLILVIGALVLSLVGNASAGEKLKVFILAGQIQYRWSCAGAYHYYAVQDRQSQRCRTDQDGVQQRRRFHRVR